MVPKWAIVKHSKEDLRERRLSDFHPCIHNSVFQLSCVKYWVWPMLISLAINSEKKSLPNFIRVEKYSLRYKSIVFTEWKQVFSH